MSKKYTEEVLHNTKMVNTNQRIIWLDIAKAIAMIAVVFCHEFASVKSLTLFLNSFMLPLFFICSGYCINTKKYKDKSYIMKKVKAFLVPYFMLGFLVSLLQIPINGIGGIANSVLNGLFSWQTLWFLPVLFFANILDYIALVQFVSKKIIWTFMLAMVFFSQIFSYYSLSLPLDLEVVFIASFYISVGYTLRLFMSRNFFNNPFIAVAIFLIGCVLMFISREEIVLKTNDVWPTYKVIYSVFVSIGILLMIKYIHVKQFTRLLESDVKVVPKAFKYISKVLKYIGENTMVIFAFHMPIFFYLQKFVRPLFESQIIYKCVEVIMIWSICLLLIPIMSKYLPILIGKRGWKN